MNSLSCAWLFVTPWTVACTKFLHPWDFLGENTGVGCHFLLQGIFLTQGSNPGLLHCRQTLYHLSLQGSSGGDGIPAELFQLVKDDAVGVLHSACQQFWKLMVATRLENISFHSKPREEQFQRIIKLPYNCPTSHATRLCSKSFKLDFSVTWTKKFQKSRLGLENAEEAEIKLPTSIES